MNIKKVLIVGATGATGKEWLHLLLENPHIDKVRVLARSKSKVEHPKLEWICTDLMQENVFDMHTQDIDAIFCSIGTTTKQTPNKTQYRAIDYGIPVRLAQSCQRNKVKIFAVISAMGANSNSRIFYNKLKGEMEEEVKRQAIDRTYIFRPSLISAPRNGSRIGEKIADVLMTVLDFMIPIKYKRIPVQKLAQNSLAFVINHAEPGLYVVESDQLQK